MTDATTKPELTKDWVNIIFLTLTPVVGIAGTAWYTWRNGFEWWMLGLFAIMYLLVGLSICGGYHRYFSHKSYECSKVVQYFYAFFGALAAQNSILWWSSSHRTHHSHVDEDWDPYNIKRGFLWAHIFWIFYKNPANENLANAPDLVKSDVVQWQNRWNKVILIVGGFGIPTLIGAMFGDAWAGLLWGGFLRLVVIHHTTFFVNSLAHYLGEQRYNAEVSARDNWIVALATLGEGYHSFHHRFPADFRNGILWFHWDPAKWFIRGLKATGLAWDLKATPAPVIEQARMHAAVKSVERAISEASPSRAEEIRQRIADAKNSLDHAFALWRQHTEERARGMSASWKEKRRQSLKLVRKARREWRLALRMVTRLPESV